MTAPAADRRWHRAAASAALAGLLLVCIHQSAAAQDPLYQALLEATPASLPTGMSAASVGPGLVDADDQKSGVLGNAQVSIAAPDAQARINYLVLPSTVMAANYLSRFGIVVVQTGASSRFVPYLPHAKCAETAKGAVCAQAIERVAVFSFGSRVETTAAPLLQAAIDHLIAVANSKGLH